MTTETPQTAGIDRTELSGTYAIDPVHSRFGFVARHAMVTKVRGQFSEFEGTLELDGENPVSSSGRLTVQAASIDTHSEDRDNHLRSNDFFAMEEYPTIEFVSTSVEATDDDTVYRVLGDLTIRGVTKPVSLDVEYLGAALDPWGKTRVGLEGSAIVNRKDWGMNWNTALEAGGVLVSDKVTLEFEIAAVKQS